MSMAPVRLAAAAILLGALIQQHGVAAQPVPATPSGPPVLHPHPGLPVVPVTNVYPRLNAPLYPSPVQYAPPWNGGSIITNQALAPHEMLYPHQYRAMYPPFYYKVVGHWVVTPMGVKQAEIWKLQGTEVKVKYHSRVSFLTKAFFPNR